MEMAAAQLGGHPVYIQKDEVGLGTRESAEDVARTLACYHAIIAARVIDHALLEQMAAANAAPVLNMLSATDHPLQALADLLTVKQLLGRLEGARIAYIGEANNVARSLAEGCALLGAEFVIASPVGFGFGRPDARRRPGRRSGRGGRRRGHRLYRRLGVDGRRGQRGPARSVRSLPGRRGADGKAPNAHFLHCLPARRGEEVTADVIDGPRSAVWRQAENRMHTARGSLLWLSGAAA